MGPFDSEGACIILFSKILQEEDMFFRADNFFFRVVAEGGGSCDLHKNELMSYFSYKVSVLTFCERCSVDGGGRFQVILGTVRQICHTSHPEGGGRF